MRQGVPPPGGAGVRRADVSLAAGGDELVREGPGAAAGRKRRIDSSVEHLRATARAPPTGQTSRGGAVRAEPGVRPTPPRSKGAAFGRLPAQGWGARTIS